MFQKEILLCLLSHCRSWQPSWGIRVKRIRHDGPKSGADRAAFSRALRRLEQRGFIVRTNVANGMPHEDPRVKHIMATERRDIRKNPHDPMVRRTDHIIVTEMGLEAAKRLT
jgi:DNA-binding MarR family transcriptional regulator